ncbi:DUF2461 domain-containing protein [Pontibacter silvestris]|uniref:DUF2461 domain-containing protein n=1 Tax=Pontibacter silvestris TaxID=2305183 RepID=A0ABW4WSW5_9BACT|nr:DUF2461 domain-containing protein [Pontibacter silvestris]MCC9138561.1 DUF2461 domain-containing protein [Pontibacter silvestris]
MDTGFILRFLGELQQHNSKAWMDLHREEYLQAKAYFTELVSNALQQLQTIDPAMHGVTATESIFRINKNDFSKKGEAPYKGYFAAGMSPGGRHSPFANYVLILEPDSRSRVGGGKWKPTPKQLELIREEIDYNPGELEAIVLASGFINSFGKVTGETRKSAPKGYNKEHPSIDLLRHNGFLGLHFFKDEEVTAPDFKEQLLPFFKQVKPLNDFINRSFTEL